MESQVVHFRRLQLIILLLSTALFSYGQEVAGEKVQNEHNNGLKFSGNINLNTNGISPVPAFSLDKPSIIATFSLERKRLSFNPEMAFSTKGKPWFINPRFTYTVIDGEKFDFGLSAQYGFSYRYPEKLVNNILQTTTRIEHYLLFRSIFAYRLSEKASMGLETLHGFGMKSASIQRGNFIILGGSITELKITEKFYYSFFPQLTYINLDGETEGLFVSGTFGVGHKSWPFFLSTQLTQPLTTNIAPNPGLKWNIGVTYIF